MEIPMSEVQKLIEFGGGLSFPRQIGNIPRPYTIIPKDWKVEDLEHLKTTPDVIAGFANFYRGEDFCDYVAEYKSESMRIFFDRNELAFTACLNFHSKDSPTWNRHKAILQLIKTLAWKKWSESSGTWRSQREFAEFIEDNTESIAKPDGVVLMELVSELTAHSRSNVTSVARTDNGSDRVVFEQTREIKAGKGSVDLPSVILLGITPFESAQSYEVKARIQCKVVDSKILLRYQLVNADLVMEHALDAMKSRVKTVLNQNVWEGGWN
jgi:uncharacterized protein YfdQ (DUF2303 family)